MSGTTPPAVPEYVNIPRSILGPVIDTHIGQMLRGEPASPKVQIAFGELFPGGSYRDLDDTVRVTAESAFWLAYYADAETLYGAGTEARANVAIEAEYTLFSLIAKQAPTTEARCDNELAVMYGEIKRGMDEAEAGDR